MRIGIVGHGPTRFITSSTTTFDFTAEQFEEAWIDRVDLVIRHDDSYESLGATDDGREVYLVWRWDISDPSRVFPITAFFLQQQEPD
jgi:hypothetical protein